jgi:hypothetical protein
VTDIYQKVAGILTKTLDRTITHTKLTESELAKRLESTGMPPEDAEMLAGMDTIIKDGAEDKINHVVEEITGVPPQTFHDFAVREKENWV